MAPLIATATLDSTSTEKRATAQWFALRLRAGEPVAVASLYERYSGLVYAIADQLLGVGASTRDVVRVVQGVFARCCREITAERCTAEQFVPWLLSLTERDVKSQTAKTV